MYLSSVENMQQFHMSLCAFVRIVVDALCLCAINTPTARKSVGLSIVLALEIYL